MTKKHTWFEWCLLISCFRKKIDWLIQSWWRDFIGCLKYYSPCNLILIGYSRPERIRSIWSVYFTASQHMWWNWRLFFVLSNLKLIKAKGFTENGHYSQYKISESYGTRYILNSNLPNPNPLCSTFHLISKFHPLLKYYLFLGIKS